MFSSALDSFTVPQYQTLHQCPRRRLSVQSRDGHMGLGFGTASGVELWVWQADLSTLLHLSDSLMSGTGSVANIWSSCGVCFHSLPDCALHSHGRLQCVINLTNYFFISSSATLGNLTTLSRTIILYWSFTGVYVQANKTWVEMGERERERETEYIREWEIDRERKRGILVSSQTFGHGLEVHFSAEASEAGHCPGTHLENVNGAGLQAADDCCVCLTPRGGGVNLSHVLRKKKKMGNW